MSEELYPTKRNMRVDWASIFRHAKCYVIVTKNVDGENPDEEPTVETLNMAVKRMRPAYPFFYDVYMHGMQMILVSNMPDMDEDMVKSLTARELSNFIGDSQHSE